MQKQLLTVNEAAEVAGIGRSYAYQYIQAGLWPSVKLGKCIRVPYSGLMEWVQEKEIEAKERAARLRDACL